MSNLASRLRDLQSAYARRGERIEALEKELTRVYALADDADWGDPLLYHNIKKGIPAELRGLAEGG